MPQKVGVVQNITGKFQAVDKNGNVRILQQGDFIYEGEAVSAIHPGEGDSTTQNGNGSTENFITIKDLRNGEIHLIPENGYRYFSIQEMGKDEAALARLGISSAEQTDDPGEDTGSGFLRGGAFAGPQEFLGDPVSPGIPEDIAIESTMDEIPDPEPDLEPDSTPDTGPEPNPNNAPVITSGGDTTGSVTEILDKAPTENIAVHTATGSLTFTDSDAGDAHTVTATPMAGGYLGDFTHTVDPVTGQIDWKFVVDDADLDHLKEGETLTQVYTVTVDDGHGGTATEDVTVTITGRNDGPDAHADSPVAVAGQNASGNVLDNDTDADGDDLSVTAFTVDGNAIPSTVGTPYTIMKGSETAGVLTLNSDGTYEFVADSNFHGTLPDITYTVTDAHGATDTALLKISVIDNSAPLIDLNSPASLSDPDTAFTALYTEDGSAVSIADTDMGINTNGGAQIERATITLTNTMPGDVLDFSGIDTAKFTVTQTTSGDDTILTITPNGGGTLPVGDFEDAIKAVTFSSTSDNPDLSDRVIEVQVNDSNSDSNVAISTITVQPANDAPVVVADTNSVTEDAADAAGHDDGNANTTVVAGDVLDNDSDPEGGTLKVVGVAQGNTGADLEDTSTVGNAVTGTYGTVTINADGTYEYALDNTNGTVQALGVGKTLTDTFTYTASDGIGGFQHTTLTITINGTNDAPVIDLDSDVGDGTTGFSTTYTEDDAAISIADTDMDVVDVDTPHLTSATITLTNPQTDDVLNAGNVDAALFDVGTSADGFTITLTPKAGQNPSHADFETAIKAITFQNTSQEPDTTDRIIEVKVNDGSLDSNVATTTISVVSVNDAPVIASGGDTGSVTEIADLAPTENIALHSATGTLTFTDNDASDTHTATATPNDSGYVGTFTPTVDDATGKVNWEFTVPDADIDHLAEGEILTQVYTVTVDDGNGGTATRDVTVTITGRNDGPVAAADSPVAVAGQNASGNVLDNDTDVDGDDLSVTAFTVDGNAVPSTVGTPYTIMKGSETAGVLTLNSDGTYEFVADSNFHGTLPDITYTVTDAHGATDTALLKISVIDNSAPIIDLNSAASLDDPDTAFTAAYTEDGPAVSIADTDMGINTNGGHEIERATITLTNTKPGDVLDTSGIDTTLFTVTQTTSGDDTILTITPVGGGTESVANFEDAIKAVTFSTTSDNPDLSDRVIEVQVNDSNSDSNIAVSTITVQAANDAPVIDAGHDTGAVTEAGHQDDGTPVPGIATASDTLTAADPDNGDSQTWSVAGTSQYGSIAIDPATGQWTYTLDNTLAATQALREGDIKTETFTATVTDSGGATDTQTITVTINGTNDAPVITSDATAAQGAVTEDAATNTATGTLTSSDVDAVDTETNHGSTWSLNTTNGTYGSIAIDADTGEWRYTLDNSLAATQALGAGETGTETFTATVTDAYGATDTQVITVTITGTNDVPVVAPDMNSVTEDAADAAGHGDGNVNTTVVAGDVLANDLDTDTSDSLNVVGVAKGDTGANSNDAATVNAGVAGDYGTVTINADGSYEYALDNTNGAVQALAVGETLTETFTYTVSDGNGGVEHTTLTITINGANDIPEITVTGTDTDNAAINETDTTLTAAGTLSLGDVDTSDDVTMSVESVVTTGSTYTGTLPSNDDLKAMFSVSGGLDSTQSSNGHGVNWSFDSGSEHFNAIPAGETVVLTYTVQADDGNGGIATHDVTITITGTNDAPVVQADTNSVTEDVSPLAVVGNVIDGEDDGTQNDAMKDTDVDHGDTLEVTGIAAGTTPAGSDNVTAGTNATDGTQITGIYGTLKIGADGSYSYQLDNTSDAVQNLAKNQSAADTFTYTVKDSQGEAQSTTLTINVTGTNDAPDIFVQAGDTEARDADETDAAINLNGTLSIADKDTMDTVTMSVESVSTNAGTILNGEEYPFGGDEAGFNAKLMEMLSFTNAQVLDGTQTGNDHGIAWNFTTTVDSTTYPFDFIPAAEDFTITYTVKATDSSGQGNTASNGNEVDNDTHTITITIHGVNDTGSLHAESVTTNEDTNLSGNVFTNATQDPDAGEELAVTTFTIDGMAGTNNAGDSVNVTSGGNTIGTLVLNSNGSYTFTPAENYSGSVPQITYSATSGGEGVGTSTLDITVKPISDAPVMGTNEDTEVTVTTNEDTAVALNGDNDWTLPTINDNSNNNGTDNGGFNERLGLLKLSGLTAGTKILDGNDNELYAATDGSEITIKITDVTDYHINDAGTATLELTQAQFEALQILPKANSSTDMTDIQLSATEYEVDAAGNVIATAGSKTSTQDIDIKVAPVTDDFTLTKETVTFSGDEDNFIKINDAFTFTKSADQDGSERYTLNFSSNTGDNNDLSHVRFRVGDSGDWKTLDEFNGTYFDGDDSMPDIYVRTIANDSRDIKGLTLTVTAQDHDQDNDGGVGSEIPHSITLNDISIVPLANDVTLKPGGAEGNEDTLIAMGLEFVNNDGLPDQTGTTNQEVVDHLIISGIPAGVKIYNGTDVVFTGDGSSDFDTSTVGTTGLTQAEIEGLKLLPPQDFSGEIELGVKVYSQDTDDDATDSTQVTTEEPVAEVTHTITVNGVVDTSFSDPDQVTEGDQEVLNTGRLYVTINNTLTTDPTAGGFTAPEFQGTEDEACAITGLSWKSYEAEQHGTTDNSETATFIIKNYGGDDTDFTLEDAGGNAIGTQVTGGWQVTEAQLANIHVKAPDDFGGTIHLALETTVKDGDDENVQTDPFDVVFTPVTEDSLTMNLTDVYATEDIPAKFDIYPETTDLDGSEKVTQVLLESIDPGVTFYIKDGENYTPVTYDNSGSLTITIDDSASPAPGTMTTEQLKNLYIKAPPESNEDFAVTVTPTVKDTGSDPSAPGVTGTQEVNIYVQGDADEPVPVNPLPAKLTGTEPQSAGENLVDISSLVHQSGETESGQAAADDNSEILTYVLHDMPSDFLPTDAAGNIIGDFVSTENGKVTWSFTQAQMGQLHIQVPVHYSGTTNLNLEIIAVEDDGDTNSTSINIPLEITPVVTTTDPVVHEYTALEPVTLHANNSGPAATSEDDTFVPLTFTNTADGETVTKVVIGTVPDGVEVGTLIDGTFTAAPSGSITGNIDHIVARIIGDGTLNDSINDIIFRDIKVTVVDPSDDGTITFPSTELTVDDITIHVEGRADQPYITGSVEDPAATGEHYNNITVSTTFPDDDGSEDHYFTVKAPDNDVLLNTGTYQGDGLWYLTKAEMTTVQDAGGLHAWFNGAPDEEKELTITAYARENDVQQNSVTVTIYGASDGTSYPAIEAQTPKLQVEDPQPNEDQSFTLADVVVTENTAGEQVTGNQDGDNGNETLSFVIKNLDMTNIESIEGVSEYTDDAGNIFYRFDVPGVEPGPGAIEAALANVIITPAEDYSGPITFTLEAVANEPTAPAGSQFASTSQEVTVNVQPVAEDALVVTTPAPVDEDSRTLVTLALSNKDASSPETFDKVSLELTETNSGQFVDASGNPLGTSLSNLTYNPDSDTFTTSGGDQVYYQPPENVAGTYPIKVTADMHDGDSTTSGATATVNIEITPIPDGGTFVLKDSSGDEVNTTDNKLEVGEDERVQLNIEANSFHDGDGSELQTVLIKDVPPGMLFYESETGTNLVGELIEVDPVTGNSIWKLPTSVMGGNLYIQPPLNYNGEIDLNVVGVAMEADAMGSQNTDLHEQSFTLDIEPVADGVQLFPETAHGEEDLPIAINLRAKLVADEEIATAELPHNSNETYNVTFAAGSEDITIFYKDGAGYHTLENKSSDPGNSYKVTGLSQDQIDSLHLQIEGNRAGSFTVGVEVSSSDGNTTSIPAKTATVGIVASYEYESQTAPAADQTVTIDGKTHIFAQSGNDEITGTAGVEVIDGGKGRDTLDGGAGADELYGGKGDDTIVFDASDAVIDGGDGEDTLQVASNVNFTQLASDLIVDMEVIDLEGNGQQTIDLDKAHVESMTDDGNTLLIKGDTTDGAKDTVNLESGWTASGSTETIDGVSYHVLTNDNATLKIEDGVNYNIA